MSTERGDSTIAKNLKGKITAITYCGEGQLKSQWLTIDGVRYATWEDANDYDLLPGTKVEHAPYVEARWKPHKIISTRIIKVLK